MFKLSDPDRGLLEQTLMLRFRLNFGSLLTIGNLLNTINETGDESDYEEGYRGVDSRGCRSYRRDYVSKE